MKIFGINDYTDIDVINKKIKNKPDAFIEKCEKRYTEEIEKASDRICDFSGRSALLLAGPSSSGKTTTAHRIVENLKSKGKDIICVSLDDFYKPKELSPVKEDGTHDFETIQALEIESIKECLYDIIFNGEALFPEFDFNIGRAKEQKIKRKLNKDGIIVIEGLHAINPIIYHSLLEALQNNLLKMYISVSDGLYKDGKEIVNRRDLRLIRRITRDYTHRASSTEETLKLWSSVVDGEKKYIDPNIDKADLFFNSFLPYEVSVFFENIVPLIRNINSNVDNYDSIKRIQNLLDLIEPLDEEYIPENSLLNEFIVIESRIN